MDDRAILYLEADEEIPTTIDRLKEEKAKVVTLVVPKASIILQSVINLKLLIRIAKEHGKTITIVSHDAIGRNLAAQVGIPAYDSVNAKMPVLEPNPRPIDDDEIVEINMSGDKKPPVKVHHFQDGGEPELSAEDKASEKADEDFATIPMAQAVPAEELEETPAEEIPSVEEITLPKKVFTNTPVSKPPRTKSKRKGLILASISALVVILIGLVIFYPKATVTLKVAGETFEGDVDISVSTKQKEVNLDDAIIPGQAFEVVKEKSDKFSATGKKDMGEKAKATINFNNGWSTDQQQFPAGTRLSKDGKIFLTTSDITIPGATLSLKEGQVVTNPGKTTGGIEASEPGDSYNVSAGKFTFTELSGDRQAKITGESTSALSGGLSKQVTVVSRGDIEQAKEKVKSSIEEEAKKDLISQAKGLVVLDKSIRVETEDATPSVSEGTQADSFTLKVKGKAKVIAFSDSAFRDTFLRKINEKVDKSKELVIGETDEIVTAVKNVDTQNEDMKITGSIKTKLGPKFDKDSLTGTISGKSADEATAKAKEISGADEASIVISPNWLFNRLPFSSRQIDIKIEYK